MDNPFLEYQLEPDDRLVPRRVAGPLLFHTTADGVTRKERTDPTFPRSIQLGGATSPRLYSLKALLKWIEMNSTGKAPTPSTPEPAPKKRGPGRPRHA